jgi:hypothetical protein
VAGIAGRQLAAAVLFCFATSSLFLLKFVQGLQRALLAVAFNVMQALCIYA